MPVEAPPDRQSKAALEKRLARAEKALSSALEAILALNAQLQIIRSAAGSASASTQMLGKVLLRADQIHRQSHIANRRFFKQ